MDSTTIALIGLVLGLVGAIVGSFAYLMGEIRKVAAGSTTRLDQAVRDLNTRIESSTRNEAQERATMRAEFATITARIEADLRRLSEGVVRRSDMDALENRLTRSAERLEQKFDNIMARLGVGAGYPKAPGSD